MCFLVLGFHVGVWAVQLANLTTALRLNAQLLGVAVTASAAAGIVTLLTGGYLADRLGRRLVLSVGFAGTAGAFIWPPHSPGTGPFPARRPAGPRNRSQQALGACRK
jgi:MFS family permease